MNSVAATIDRVQPLATATATVLDVGGGPGGHACWLAARGYRVHLIDVTPLHVELARQASARQPGAPLAGAEVGDARALPWPDGAADAVVLFGPLYHLTERADRLKALREAHRVLRPGGELIILTRVSADAGMRRFIEQRLQPVVRPLGFRTAEFAWSRYAKWLAGARGMELVERRLVPPLGHFSLVRFRKIDIAAAA